MTITIDLTPDEEARLSKRAAAAGLAPERYLRSLIADVAPEPASKLRNGAELIAFLEANKLFGPYGDPTLDSSELAVKLRKDAETRNWA